MRLGRDGDTGEEEGGVTGSEESGRTGGQEAPGGKECVTSEPTKEEKEGWSEGEGGGEEKAGGS